MQRLQLCNNDNRGHRVHTLAEPRKKRLTKTKTKVITNTQRHKNKTEAAVHSAMITRATKYIHLRFINKRRFV